MVYFARWAAPRQVPVAFDCAAGARALLAGDVTLAQDGRIEGAEWVTLPPDDPALVTVCTGLAAPA
jgi:hypothetical protein